MAMPALGLAVSVTCMMVLSWSASVAQAAATQDIVNARDTFVGSSGVVTQPENLETFLQSIPATSTLSLVQQVEGTGNRTSIEQTGTANRAVVYQGFGDDNELALLQQGIGSDFLATQRGSSNRIEANQLGNDNDIVATQSGIENSLLVNQFGDANQLRVDQIDDFNRAVITQNGNTTLDVVQTNAGGTSASVNDLTLSARVEAGYTSNFSPIRIDGAGTQSIALCSGSPAFCAP